MSALGATAELVGGDADAYRPAGSSGARICTRGRPLAIAGAAGSATAAPNQCVLAAPDATLAVAAPPPARLALPQSAAEECYDFRAAIAAFTPGTVGAGPDDWLVPAWYQGGPERSPCDDPGSGCSAVTAKASKKKPSIKHPKHPKHLKHPKHPKHLEHPRHHQHPKHPKHPKHLKHPLP